LSQQLHHTLIDPGHRTNVVIRPLDEALLEFELARFETAVAYFYDYERTGKQSSLDSAWKMINEYSGPDFDEYFRFKFLISTRINDPFLQAEYDILRGYQIKLSNGNEEVIRLISSPKYNRFGFVDAPNTKEYVIVLEQGFGDIFMAFQNVEIIKDKNITILHPAQHAPIISLLKYLFPQFKYEQAKNATEINRYLHNNKVENFSLIMDLFNYSLVVKREFPFYQLDLKFPKNNKIGFQLNTTERSVEVHRDIDVENILFLKSKYELTCFNVPRKDYAGVNNPTITNWKDTYDLLKDMSALICADSGILHLGVLMGLKTICLVDAKKFIDRKWKTGYYKNYSNFHILDIGSKTFKKDLQNILKGD
jgi:hypothetical protein